MSATTTPLTGDALLVGVTDAMVALHQHYYHRKPVAAKTTLLGGDLLACVLGGVYTDVEKTMIELERTTIVQETRSAFQNAMQHKFIAAIEHLSGRDVLAFISNHHVGPDMEIEFFLLQPNPDETSAARDT
jgi:uncharacterized protein YbcI